MFLCYAGVRRVRWFGEQLFQQTRTAFADAIKSVNVVEDVGVESAASDYLANKNPGIRFLKGERWSWTKWDRCSQIRPIL